MSWKKGTMRFIRSIIHKTNFLTAKDQYSEEKQRIKQAMKKLIKGHLVLVH